MSRATPKSGREAAGVDPVPVVPRSLAGRWIAWSADGRRIVAEGDTRKACERAAAAAGFPEGEVAFEKVPSSRRRITGSGT